MTVTVTISLWEKYVSPAPRDEQVIGISPTHDAERAPAPVKIIDPNCCAPKFQDNHNSVDRCSKTEKKKKHQASACKHISKLGLICTVRYAKGAPHSEQLEKRHMYWLESGQVACLGVTARNPQMFRKHACLSWVNKMES